MNKKLIRLTENDLHRIVKQSVNNVLREDVDNGMSLDNILSDKIQEMLTQNGLEYDKAFNGYNVYAGDDMVSIKIIKQGNITYPRR